MPVFCGVLLTKSACFTSENHQQFDIFFNRYSQSVLISPCYSQAMPISKPIMKPIKRLVTSLCAIACVSAIFGAKAVEQTKLAAALSNADRDRMALADTDPISRVTPPTPHRSNDAGVPRSRSNGVRSKVQK